MTTEALCKGRYNLELWFEPEHFPKAVSICKQCPFQEGCLQDALDHKMEFGVWGGTTPHDRGFRHKEDGREHAD